jgi:RNA polymerase sigma factor (sigma-70 family)
MALASLDKYRPQTGPERMTDRSKPRLTVVKTTPPAGPPDRDLLADVLTGNQSAFRTLVERHLPRMLAVARRLLGNDAEAEDVAQEAALKLWRNAGKVEVTDAGLGGWLYRVTSNLSLDRLRSRRPEVADALDTLSVAPEQQRGLLERDLSSRVDAALQALPDRQRAALVLCHYEELSMAEAGEILEISAEAVESLLARGRRALKAALADDWRSLLPSDSDNGQL